jgi:hypothetical protein
VNVKYKRLSESHSAFLDVINEAMINNVGTPREDFGAGEELHATPYPKNISVLNRH